MTHKDRIKWFLTLQQIVKLSKNRIAPTMLNLSKQPRPYKDEMSGNVPVIAHQGTSLVYRTKVATPPQAALLEHRNKVRVQRPDDVTAKPASPTPLLIAKKFYTLPKSVQQSSAKLGHRFAVSSSLGHDIRHPQMHVEQRMELRKLASAVQSIDFTKKAFAPGQPHPPPPMYINSDTWEAASLGSRQQTDYQPVMRDFKGSEASPEPPFSDDSNVMLPVQKTEAAVNQDQASSTSSAYTSTLHLDGSSLGRWAIQHLERVLSRPSSGMTGVDPRATVPRSRVAPF